jgi:hypothetical protein
MEHILSDDEQLLSKLKELSHLFFLTNSIFLFISLFKKILQKFSEKKMMIKQEEE